MQEGGFARLYKGAENINDLDTQRLMSSISDINPFCHKVESQLRPGVSVKTNREKCSS